MAKKLYVGNLPYDITEEALRASFEACGTVESARIIMDKMTGRSKGFGFVEMADDAAAQSAIQKLNKSKLGEREITVNEARPMEPRSGGGNRGGGWGGGGNRGGGRSFGGGGRY